MSDDSNATSAFVGGGSPGWPVLCCSVLMNFNSLFKFRIAQRQERLGLQISGKDREPDSGQRQDGGNVHQAGNGARGELRARQPEEIDQAHENEPDSDFGQHLGAALEIAREKQKKRHKKVKDQDENSDDTPASIEPGAIETDFLGQVAGPDDEELGKTEISPEHDESKEKFAEVVQVAVLDDAFHGRGPREQHEDGDHQGHRGDHLPDDEEETVDRRGPVRRKRHNPVDGGESHDKDIENDAGTRKHFHPAAKRPVFAVYILLFRPTIKYEDQNKPDHKINHRANQKPAAGEVGLLKVRKRSLARRRRIEPFSIEVLHPENGNGKEEHRDHWKDARSGLQGPASHDAPVAAGKMLQHQQAERPQRQSENEHESNQIGVEKSIGELIPVQEETDNEGYQAGDARTERALLEAADAFGRHVVLRGHFAEPPAFNFSRRAGGSSETGALRLSWSARTYATMAQRSAGGICAE